MIHSEVTTITPEMASRFLEGMVNNRNVSERIVARYADDMKNGEWRLTHQGIAIDEDGQLIDGQHRLWAIIESDTPVKMMVTRGVCRDSLYGVDGGKPRSDADRIVLGGLSDWVKVKEVAIVRMMLTTRAYNRATSTSLASIVDIAGRYEKEIKYTNDLFSSHSKGVASCPVRAGVVLALINKGATPEQVAHFVEVLQTGITQFPYDLLTIRFRDHVTQTHVHQTGTMARLSVMKKSQRALKATVDKQKVSNLVEPQDFIWKLPEG